MKKLQVGYQVSERRACCVLGHSRSTQRYQSTREDRAALRIRIRDLAAVLQALEVSESTLDRWRKQYGGMKAEEAVRLKKLEDENKRLKEIVADQQLDIKALKFIAEGNW